MTIQDVHSNGAHPDVTDVQVIEPDEITVDDVVIDELDQAIAADTEVLDPAVRAPRRVRTDPPGTRRTYDYRLRGLDLDALAKTEPVVGAATRRRSSSGRRLRRTAVQAVVVLAALALVAGVLRVAVVRPYHVQSTSMVPTIWPDTDVLVATTSLLSGSVKRGDIVVLRVPQGATCAGGASAELVSRVIGLPGDTIWSAEERIYINGALLDEPTWHNPPYGEVGPRPVVRTTVPKGSYFVMGDNRTDPCDSRVFGPVASADVVGEVLVTTMRDGHPYVRGL